MNSYFSSSGQGEFIPIPKEPHNKNVRNNAEGHTFEMRKHPSYLEQKMIELLDSWKVQYEFQKIIYIRSKGGFIKQYYIADFYIPKKHLIIEVDGQFHKEQSSLDELRTKTIQKHYPKITVARWENRDFTCYNSLKQLKKLVGK